MKEKRILVAVGALSAALTACSAEIEDQPTMAGPMSPPGTTPPGTTPPGTTPTGTTPPGTTPTSAPTTPGTTPPPDTMSPPPTCTPGTPATSQIPRLLNRQYDAVVRDLLGVTGVGTDNKPPSELLVDDSDGPMTPDTWRIYQDVAGQIAKTVMAGANKSKFMSCDAAAAGCLDQTIRAFGRQAFRRPLTDAEVTRFLKLGQTTPAGTPAEVAEATLQAFLVSPSFLLIPELSAETEGTAIKLSQYEVASRLSFLLWDSVPDAALSKAADDGALTTKEQIKAQAERMIAVREKTGPLISAFHRDWAQMNSGAGHWFKPDHDTKTYPLYNAAAKPSWQKELDAFFQEVAYTGGSFKDLLLSNVAFVNKDNAAIYGLDPAAFGTELTKTTLDANQRPGFLTRVGFLSSYSGYNSTSPILRGAFITVYMLGGAVGPPIPGATMATVDGVFKTQRAYVEALTMPAACVGCHTVINPAGFVMENYDGIGKWQTADPLGGAIDASVTTATVNIGGTPKEISSPLQFMTEIAQNPLAKQRYAQAWVSYAFGREPNANDQCVVNQLDTQLSQTGYSILNLLADLTQADSFRLRARQTP